MVESQTRDGLGYWTWPELADVDDTVLTLRQVTCVDSYSVLHIILQVGLQRPVQDPDAFSI